MLGLVNRGSSSISKRRSAGKGNLLQ
uniref:Uncharacterized protein n=1 Tax=Rhizophora mucronata TaxID=61149 RepID=A0A2P2QDX6_RHIMU